MNQSSRDHTLLGVRPSPDPGRGAVSSQSSRDKRAKRSLPGSTVRKEGRAISAQLAACVAFQLGASMMSAVLPTMAREPHTDEVATGLS